MAAGRAGGTEKSGGGGASDHGSHDPMDQYIQLLSPAPGSAPPDPASVRAVLHQALTNPRVYAGFAELRSLPAVVEALEKSGTGGDSAFRTLDLFAYGTHGDYTSAKEGTYLTLTDGQEHKLRQLTVVSLVQRTAAEAATAAASSARKPARRRGRKGGGPSSSATCGASVPYSSLRSELSLPPDSPVRELEDLLISCLYSGLVVGRLDQRSMSLLVGPRPSGGSAGHGGAHQPPCTSRDVRPGGEDVSRMIEALEAFHRRGEEVAKSLGEAAKAARDGRTADAERWAAVEERVREMRARAKERVAGGGGTAGGPGAGGGMEGDSWGAAMDIMGGGGDGGVGMAAAMDISMEGGGGGGPTPGPGQRQSKRSRGGYGGGYGGEPYGRY